MTPNLCALVGNGLSMTYSHNLSIPALTTELVEAFRGLGGEEAANALRALPSKLTGTDREDFEALLSPFEFGAESMAYLSALAPLAVDSQGGVDVAFARVRSFLRRTHQLGLGLALEAIDRHAHVRHDARFRGTVVRFAEAVTPQQFLPVRIFTPNYDNLLHSAFLGMDRTVSDLADGRESKSFHFVGSKMRGLRIRLAASELMASDVTITNLHGSLNWLTHPKTGDVWKFSIDDLRYLGENAEGYWELLARGDVKTLPSVVLTDRKEDVVKQWPFSLAYEVMEASFARCPRWLIAGFSFGDHAINAALRRAVRALGSRPLCLVLGHGSDQEVLEQARGALGHGPRYIVDGTGLPGSLNGGPWQEWERETL